MPTMTKKIAKNKISIKAQTLFGLCAAAAAVILPQILHTAGTAFGIGSALGETFLPMHLPVLIVGFTAGPVAGCIAGLLAPIISFAMSGMPSVVLLPFMVIELFSYGLFSGIINSAKMPDLCKVLSVQVIGRAIRAVAIAIAVYGFGYGISVSIIWASIVAGIGGIALQLVIVPLAMRLTKNKE